MSALTKAIERDKLPQYFFVLEKLSQKNPHYGLSLIVCDQLIAADALHSIALDWRRSRSAYQEQWNQLRFGVLIPSLRYGTITPNVRGSSAALNVARHTLKSWNSFIQT